MASHKARLRPNWFVLTFIERLEVATCRLTQVSDLDTLLEAQEVEV
jgi:hypothetical protein